MGSEAEEVGNDEAHEDEEARSEEDVNEEVQMIEPCSVKGKVVVRQRQGLQTSRRCEQFVRQLEARIEQEKDAGEMLVFEDFDISQNIIESEHLESMLSLIADGGVHVERFRAFGVPTLDDQASTLLAGWLSGVTTENVPFELHLSDCAITQDGFEDIMKALGENEAFPGPDPREPSRGPLPLYLRLENNFIDPEAMDRVVSDGVACKSRKGRSGKMPEGAKVRIIVRDDDTFGQKTGSPPAPEDAPVPRSFKARGKNGSYDNSMFAFGAKGSGKGDRDRWSSKGKGKSRDSAPPWQTSRQALPAPSTSDSYPRRTDFYSSSASKVKGKRELRSPEPKRYMSYSSAQKSDNWSNGYSSKSSYESKSSNEPYNAFSSRGGGGAKRGADKDWQEPSKRARTSAEARPSGGKGGKSKSGAKEGSKLSYPWEEHWSDEYEMNYYWNSKTGDSTWERPGGR